MRTFAIESLPLLADELRNAANQGPVHLTIGGHVIGVFQTEEDFEEQDRALDHVLGTYASGLSERGDFLSPKESVDKLNGLIDAARPLAS